MSHEAEIWAKGVKVGSGTLKAVLRAIAWYADANGVCWPSQEKIAEDTELSARCVRNAIQALVEKGLILREERRRKDGTRQSDLMHLAIGGPFTRNDVPPAEINRHLVPDQPAPHDTSTGTSRHINRHEVPVLYEPSKELLEERLLEKRSPRVREAREALPTRIDPGWRPDEIDVEAAIAEGVPRDGVASEAARFVDKRLEDGTTSCDWRASWRRWCRYYRSLRPNVQPFTGRRQDRGYDPPPTGQAARVAELHRLIEERDRGTADRNPRAALAEPEREHGQDRGVAWVAGGGARPTEPLLRAVGEGGHDHRAAAALRRARPA